MLNRRKASQKERARPSHKEKVNGLLGHGIRIRVGIRIKETKKVKTAKTERKGLLSGLWQSRSSSTSMLVEQSAAAA